MTQTNALPRYRSHKVVQAAKIIGFDGFSTETRLMLDCGDSVSINEGWVHKHNPEIGGYFVLYEDGYQSYSPAAAFEAGYRRLEDIGCSTGVPDFLTSVAKQESTCAIHEPPNGTFYFPSGSSLYRKKPVVIEARQFNGKWTGDGTEILNWMGRGGDWDADTAELSIRTLEGVMTASAGDWIIKGVKGEFYPCKPDIFAATYEAVEVECIDLEAADFSDALLWLKEGKRICRAGWNGKDQYAILIPGKHLAQSAGYGFGESIGEFTFGNVLSLKNAQNIMQPGWVPSMGDLMATDWLVYDGVAGADEQQPECSE